MITGMITSDGLLLICRKGAYIQQECPLMSTSGIECGDWCPHFQEPLEISSSTIQLQLCQKTQLVFARLDDYRSSDRFDEEDELPDARGVTL